MTHTHTQYEHHLHDKLRVVPSLYNYSDPTITDPLTCYEPTPSGEVEPDVEVVASELRFVPAEDIVPPPDATIASPIKSSSPLKQVPSSSSSVQLTRTEQSVELSAIVSTYV